MEKFFNCFSVLTKRATCYSGEKSCSRRWENEDLNKLCVPSWEQSSETERFRQNSNLWEFCYLFNSEYSGKTAFGHCLSIKNFSTQEKRFPFTKCKTTCWKTVGGGIDYCVLPPPYAVWKVLVSPAVEGRVNITIRICKAPIGSPLPSLCISLLYPYSKFVLMQ